MTMHVLFVFLDGVGLGPASVAAPDGSAGNPFAHLALPAFERLAGGQRWTDALRPLRRPDHVCLPLDATLGVDGLPQSGTGQTALFTGQNAAARHGAHYGPTPPTTVRGWIDHESLFAHVARRDGPDALAFANAFPDRFFEVMDARGRWTATTRMARGAGVRLRRAADLRAGDALAADLTGAGWRDAFDPTLAAIGEAEAGARLVRLTHRHRLTLFEYFLTDKAGHAQDPARAATVLQSLDRFLGAVLAALDPARDLLVLTSDHGNLEDLSTRSHTTHPVPLVAWGAGAAAFADADSLLDVTSAVLEVLALPSP